MKIARRLTELIGNTPMLQLNHYAAMEGLPNSLFVKAEYFNPAGSVKDRIALSMVEDAEERGLLGKGTTIIEPTSGNTGIGLAMVCAVKGYRLLLVMPENMSRERLALIRAYGAEVEITPADEGMQGAVDRAMSLSEKMPSSLVLHQFENSANPLAHYRFTAEEIWRDTDGKVELFVAGVGTGGTITGVGRRLKELNPDIRVVAVEPASSPVLSGGKKGIHKLQGIGAGFIPKNYDAAIVDEILLSGYDDAVSAVRNLARYEGLLVGYSSGAALSAAVRLAKRSENASSKIVVMLPDGGERYLSTDLFF